MQKTIYFEVVFSILTLIIKKGFRKKKCGLKKYLFVYTHFNQTWYNKFNK